MPHGQLGLAALWVTAKPQTRGGAPWDQNCETRAWLGPGAGRPPFCPRGVLFSGPARKGRDLSE